MTTVTYLDDDQRLFRRIKAKTAGPWTFLVSGEWSQSPHHQGDVRFFARSSEDKTCWGILESSFPKRIVVAAHFGKAIEIEGACATMLQRLRERGGEYIDFAHEFGDIDQDLFWDMLNCTPD
jgi:hypothetical protein